MENLIEVFRKRARYLRRFATATLVLICAVILSGAVIFLYAGTLTNNEAKFAALRQLTSTRDDARKYAHDGMYEMERFDYEIRDIDKNIARELVGNNVGKSGHGPIMEALKQQRKYLLEQRTAQSENIRDRLRIAARVEDQIENLTKDVYVPQFNFSQAWPVISAVATRVGIVVLLLFLVRILVPLYRYNMRLAAFHDARADALTLYSLNRDISNTERFASLVLSLSPDSMDFGEAPASPNEYAFDLAKQVINSKLIK